MRIAALMLLLIIPARCLRADTDLSVAPLADALQNPELFGDNPGDARLAVTALLLNKPVGETETARFHRKLSELAKFRNTRVGKLFFRCLETLANVQQAPAEASEVELLARRPLGLDAVARVHVAWRLESGSWKISRLEVYLEGAASAPVVKAAPYFSDGPPMSEWLDAPEIEYLLGRDPTRRHLDQPPFDFDRALQDRLGGEQDAFSRVITRLRGDITPRTERAARIAALTPHLARAEQSAMAAADADARKRDEFWRAVIDRLANAEAAARPSAVPVARGSELSITVKDAQGARIAACHVRRLQSGEIAPRVAAD